MKYDISAFHRYVKQRFGEKGYPGVAITIRGPEGVIFEEGYGFRDEGKTQPVDGNTIFGIASMSKSMTSLACAILEVEGKLSFSDPVSKYFPEFSIPGTPKECVTLRHLAMHTAGIPPIPPLEWSIAMNSIERESEWSKAMRETAPNKMDRIEQIIDYIANSGQYTPLGAPGEYMSYSNEGYAILSYVVDQAAGICLEEFLETRVFQPLGMMRTVLDLDCSKARAISGGNITSLFEKEEDGAMVCDDNWSVLPPFRGCACVKSTSSDITRYYKMLSDKGMWEGKQVIDGRAVEILMGREFPETQRDFYCLGLEKRLIDGRVVCDHSGGLHGVSTCGGFMEGGYSAAVLCNQGDVDMEELQWACYNLILGLPLETTHYWAEPSGTQFSAPDAVVGDYLAKEGVPSHCLVSKETNGSLKAEYSGKQLELRHCFGSVFAGFRTDETQERSTTVEFYIRDGRAWAARCGTRIFQRIPD